MNRHCIVARTVGARIPLVLLACCAMLSFATLVQAGVGAVAATVAREGGAHAYRDANYDYFVACDPSRPRAKRTEFGLALMGGGGGVDDAFRFIADRAGRGHIVILGAVSDDVYDATDGGYGDAFVSKWGPVASAETIVFHNRKAATDPRVVAIIRSADGIFLRGGDQSLYVRYWKGTPVQEALNAHLRANRPIGGTSAGLAILGHYSYTAFDGGSMESKVALANPFDAGMTIEDDFLHARGLERVITDTHFAARSRLGRLIAFLARIAHDRRGAGVVGLGVDEKTAVLVGADGIGRLCKGAAGSAWLVAPTEAPVLREGEPLTMRGIAISRVGPESAIDFKSLTVSKPSATTTLAIERGEPGANALVGAMIRRDKPPADED